MFELDSRWNFKGLGDGGNAFRERENFINFEYCLVLSGLLWLQKVRKNSLVKILTNTLHTLKKGTKKAQKHGKITILNGILLKESQRFFVKNTQKI